MHVYYTCSGFSLSSLLGLFSPKVFLTGSRRNRDPNHLCTVHRLFGDFGVSVILCRFFLGVIFSGVLKRGFKEASILVFVGFFFYLSNSKSNFQLKFFEVTVTGSETGNDLILYLAQVPFQIEKVFAEENADLFPEALALGLQGS